MIVDSSNARVLLVGERRPLFSPLFKRLEERGYDTEYAGSCREAIELMLHPCKAKTATVVLAKVLLPDGAGRRLIPSVTVARGSLFLSFPVEDGCWWIPAVRKGQLVRKATAFHSREFAKVLLEILWRPPHWLASPQAEGARIDVPA